MLSSSVILSIITNARPPAASTSRLPGLRGCVTCRGGRGGNPASPTTRFCGKRCCGLREAETNRSDPPARPPRHQHHLHALRYHHQPQPALMPPPQPQPGMMSPPQPQQHHHASLASHFHLLHLVTRLADAIGTGTRDQNFDALVEELTSQFARCQQLLNSISGTISSKSTTVDGQRQSLDETWQLLDQRKELIAKYRSSVEDLLKGDTR